MTVEGFALPLTQPIGVVQHDDCIRISAAGAADTSGKVSGKRKRAPATAPAPGIKSKARTEQAAPHSACAAADEANKRKKQTHLAAGSKVEQVEQAQKKTTESSA